MECKHCGSEKTRKNGVSKGYQRYKCNACGRTFSGTPEKFSAKTKATAVFMSINGVGIRKIALFLGTSHVNVLNWLKKANQIMQQALEKSNSDYSEEPDIIELDEIYTFVKKKGRRYPVWTAYSRNAKRVIAFVIGWGKKAAMAIYRKVKRLRPNISHIYSDANSCYAAAFKTMKIPEPHTMTKTQTHLIESSNSSIRDNLARFNRRTKRYSKSLEMLQIALELLFHKEFFELQ